MILSRTHKIRLKPTKAQAHYFFKLCGAYNHAYNYAVEQYHGVFDRNREAYKKWDALPEGDRPEKPESEKFPHHFAMKKIYNKLKYANTEWHWVTECYSESAPDAFVKANLAKARYFDIATGKIALPPPKIGPDGKPKKRNDGKPRGFPRIRSIRKGDISFYISNPVINPALLAQKRIQFDKKRCGMVSLCEPLRYPDAKINGARVVYDGVYWYIAISCQVEIPEPIPSPNAVGVDVGIKYLGVSSDGQTFENPKATYKYQRKLAVLQRKLDRQRRANNPDNYNEDGTVIEGRLSWRTSSRMKKTELEIKKVHNKIVGLRRNSQHQMTHDLAQYGIIGIEDLNVRGMLKNRKLAKAISDSGFNELFRQIEYKSEGNGGTVVKIDQWFPSSKKCSGCGVLNTELTLGVRQWTCEECGQVNERDLNASVNILNETLRILAE